LHEGAHPHYPLDGMKWHKVFLQLLIFCLFIEIVEPSSPFIRVAPSIQAWNQAQCVHSDSSTSSHELALKFEMEAKDQNRQTSIPDHLYDDSYGSDSNLEHSAVPIDFSSFLQPLLFSWTIDIPQFLALKKHLRSIFYPPIFLYLHG
jgi:hypothetical protein